MFSCRYCQMDNPCWIHTQPTSADGTPSTEGNDGKFEHDWHPSWAEATAQDEDWPSLEDEFDYQEIEDAEYERVTRKFENYDPITSIPTMPQPLVEDNMRTYSSWYQFIRDADQTNDLNRQRESRSLGNGGWAGSSNWAETMQLATTGWPDGLRRVKDQIRILERFVSQRQPHQILENNVIGPGILDLGRYQQGRPDAWVVWQPESTKDGQSPKIIPIIVNISASSGVNTDVLFRRGAAVCALIDTLERMDIRVELTIVEKARYNRTDSTFKVIVKRAEDILDMDRIAFALCNASVLRRLMFSIAEQYVPNLPSSYGSPATYSEPDAIVLDSASLHMRNAEDMVAWMIKQLSDYGIEVD